jgi:hypothetical protein
MNLRDLPGTIVLVGHHRDIRMFEDDNYLHHRNVVEITTASSSCQKLYGLRGPLTVVYLWGSRPIRSSPQWAECSDQIGMLNQLASRADS